MLTSRIKRLEARRIAPVPAPKYLPFLPKEEMVVLLFRRQIFSFNHGYFPDDFTHPPGDGGRAPTSNEFSDALEPCVKLFSELVSAGRLDEIEGRLAARGIPHVPREKWWPIGDCECAT
jgi:hypothetical protein